MYHRFSYEMIHFVPPRYKPLFPVLAPHCEDTPPFRRSSYGRAHVPGSSWGPGQHCRDDLPLSVRVRRRRAKVSSPAWPDARPPRCPRVAEMTSTARRPAPRLWKEPLRRSVHFFSVLAPVLRPVSKLKQQICTPFREVTVGALSGHTGRHMPRQDGPDDGTVGVGSHGEGLNEKGQRKEPIDGPPGAGVHRRGAGDGAAWAAHHCPQHRPLPPAASGVPGDPRFQLSRRPAKIQLSGRASPTLTPLTQLGDIQLSATTPPNPDRNVPASQSVHFYSPVEGHFPLFQLRNGRTWIIPTNVVSLYTPPTSRTAPISADPMRAFR